MQRRTNDPKAGPPVTGRTSDVPAHAQTPDGAAGEPGEPRGRSIPLKPAVLLVVMAITLPVLLAIIQINYRSTDRVVRDHAMDLVETFRAETVEDIAGEFRTFTALIATAAELGGQEPGFFGNNRSLGYLLRVLQHSQTAINTYVGMADGSFRQARRISDPSIAIHDSLPPPGAEFAWRLLEPEPDQPLLDRYVFLDGEGRELGEVAVGTDYDPRERPWYRQAAEAGTTTMTDPEIFWAFGLVGFTVAAPFGQAPGAGPDGADAPAEAGGAGGADASAGAGAADAADVSAGAGGAGTTTGADVPGAADAPGADAPAPAGAPDAPAATDAPAGGVAPDAPAIADIPDLPAIPAEDAGGPVDPAGVVAIDVTLDNFSAYLADNPLSPNSVSYLLDDGGNVLAASDRSMQYGDDNRALRLPHVTDLGDRLVALAYANRPQQAADEVFSYVHEGQEYIVGLSDFADDLGKPWRLMVLTPLADFTAELTRNNRHMMIFGLVAVAVQLLIIYLVASLVASPLRRLSAKVARIQALEPGDDLPAVQSSVREIAALSRAIDTLDIAVQAFARFVPVGLVRQLLMSDQKLDIGGQSKFLTIFFSDMEGFSALAERIASRELLQRISTMLELVSGQVHRERGTIDKFVGDGVMAFWGAPASLDDHAWHACVAALRIQQQLERMNAGWRADEAPPMRLRVGIHSDSVLVGNVGSKERMSYTVLGDGVNIAARLEALNKEYGTLICISHDTFREAGDRLCVRPVDEVSVKGRRARITVYELLGAYEAGGELEPDAADLALARATRAAFDALVAGDRAGALAGYRAVLDLRPDDPVARVHVDRLTGEVPARLAEVARDDS